MNTSKKLIYFSLFVLGLILFATPTLAATPSSGVLNERSNIRDSAGYTKILTKLDKNTKVTIIGETAEWYQISLKDRKKGWVIKWLVDVAAPAKIIKPKTGKLNYASRVRKTPKIITGNIVETLCAGTKVEITGAKDDFYSVKYGASKTGWIAQFLVATNTTENVVLTSTVSTSSPIASTTFASINDINKYWQQEINKLRKAKGLRELVIDQRFINTAAKWANYCGQIKTMTHNRPNGGSAQDWINEQGITFTKRNSVDGWKTNYFSENLGYRLNIPSTLEGVKTAMDSILRSYLNEGATGVHYKSVYYPDWNSFGAGWFPIKNSNGTYTIYFVFHYGSLVL